MNQRIRLEFDIDDPTYLPPNLYDPALRTPQAFRGAPLRIEVALFHGHQADKTLVSDAELAGLSALGLGAKDRSNLTGSYSIGPVTSQITAGLTLDSWNNGTACLAAFTFIGAATNVLVSALQSVLYSIDLNNYQMPLGITNLDLQESGLGGNIPPVSALRTRVTAPLQLQWPDGLWYTLVPAIGDDNKPTLQISANGEA